MASPTLRLRLRGVRSEEPLVIRALGIASAYRLWANGELLASNGQVGRAPASTRPTELRPLTRHRNLDLVLQVASFEGARFGVFKPLALGTESALVRRQQALDVADHMIFGALLLLGLYHLVVFLYRRRERAALLIATICFLWGLRIPVAGMSGRTWTLLEPWLSWEAACKLDLVAYSWAVVAVATLIANLYPQWRSGLVARLSMAAAGAFSLLVVFDHRLALDGTLEWNFVSGPLAAYCVALASRQALSDRRPGSAANLLSVLVLAAAGIHDLLLDFALIRSESLMPAAVLVFVLLQSVVVAARLYRAFTRVETLSVELERTNKELERKDKLKDEFLAMTSHELRTPLHGMVGIADSLLKGAAGPTSEEAVRNLSLVVASGRRLSHLVDDILDYSRLKHRDLRLEVAPVRLRPVVEAVLAMVRPLVRGGEVRLENAVPEDLPAMVADEDRLHQILYNLVGNAIRFTSSGSVRVEAIATGERIEVAVVDTGRGIPADQLDRVFESFEHGNPSDGSAGGTGLGLAVSRRLVELHGGTMSVESEVGRYSRFLFTVPAAVGAPASAFARPQAAKSTTSTDGDVSAAVACDSEQEPRSGGGRVLVVDDEAVNQAVVANHLRLEGLSVETASSGTEALKRLDEGALPDVVLLDVMMPGIDGFEVCRRLRARWSAVKLPVVLLTVLNRKEDLVRGFEAGANDYLAKPFQAEELVARVRSQIAAKRAVAAIEENLRLENELEARRRSEAQARGEAARESEEKLRYQLDPHFLLNALAAIRGSLGQESPSARQAISDLGEFCKLTLARGPLEVLKVEEELEIVRAFLEVHKARWGSYLQVETEVDSAVLCAPIPAWLLQPLVENALKHGSRTSPRALQLRIAAGRQGDGRLWFRISNTGRLLSRDEEVRSGGIGMVNLRKRIERWYPEGSSLGLRTEAGWVHAELTVPAKCGPLETESAPPAATEL